MPSTNNGDAKRNFDAKAAADAISDLPGLTGAMVDAEISAMNLVPPKGSVKDRVVTYLTARGVRSQGELAAAVLEVAACNKVPVDGATLTGVLKAGFPQAQVDKRHGPHYLSLARHGNLKGVTKELPVLPHEKRVARASSKPAPEAKAKKGEVVEAPMAKATKSAPAKAGAKKAANG